MKSTQHMHGTSCMYRIIKKDILGDRVKIENVEFIQFICLSDGVIFDEIRIMPDME